MWSKSPAMIFLGLMLVFFCRPVMAGTDIQELRGFRSLGIELDLLIEGLAINGRVSDIYEIRSPRCSVICFREWLERRKVPVFFRNEALTFAMGQRVGTILLQGHATGFYGRLIFSDFGRGLEANQEWPFGEFMGVKVIDVGRSGVLDKSRTVLMNLPSRLEVQRMVRHAVSKGYWLSIIEPDRLFVLTKGSDEIWMQVRTVTGAVSLLVIRTTKTKA